MAGIAGATLPRVLTRVVREQGQSTVLELAGAGIYVEPLQLDSSSQLPIHVHVLLVSLHPHAVPHLARFTYTASYPYHPPIVNFLSRVPHPLISDDGSIDLNIFGSQWSPALTMRTVLASLQSVLANPTDPDVLVENCVRNPDWELGAFATPAQHASMMFDMLMKASQPPHDGGDPIWSSEHLVWKSWRFLRGLRSLLCMHPHAYASSPRAWYGRLRSLANLCVAHREYLLPVDPAAPDEAKPLWIEEAQTVLKNHFRFDGLRMILCVRRREGNLGSLQRINRVWSLIRLCISDIEDEELFANNHSVDAVEGHD